MHDDPDPRRRECRDRPGNGRPDGVVAAVGAADPDHQDAGPGAGHDRCTRRSRKCVAQEMHGS